MRVYDSHTAACECIPRPGAMGMEHRITGSVAMVMTIGVVCMPGSGRWRHGNVVVGVVVAEHGRCTRLVPARPPAALRQQNFPCQQKSYQCQGKLPQEDESCFLGTAESEGTICPPELSMNSIRTEYTRYGLS